MAKFFVDQEKKIMNAQLFDEDALMVAKSFFDTFTDRQGREKKNMVSSSQLRRFYNEVKSIEKKLMVDGWASVFPLVKMLKSKVSYATSRSVVKKVGEEKVYSRLKEFIIDGVNSITDEKDFYAFSKYFEAVVGYYYGEGGK